MISAAKALLFLALPAQLTAFHAMAPRFRSSLLLGNKIDSIPIEGDLQPLSNNLLVKVKEVSRSYLLLPLTASIRWLRRQLEVFTFRITLRSDPLKVKW